MKDAQEQSGLHFRTEAPDLLIEGEVSSSRASGATQPDLAIVNSNEIFPVLKCEVEDTSAAECIGLSKTIEELRAENRALQKRISKMESQKACDLSQVFLA